MTGAALAEPLARRGLDPAALAAAAALCDRVLAAFRSLSAGDPHGAWWVPGRLEVFGKHTDYAGGRSLVAALPRGFIVIASPRSGETVRVLDAGSGERATFESGRGSNAGWHQYVDVVVRRLRRNFPDAHQGADIAFASNLPRASGMSSSSALVVGVATALVKVWSLEERPAWRSNIPDAAALATYFASIERGATFGTLEGHEGVGTHGGSEDHAAMLLGVPHAVSGLSFVPLRRLEDVAVPGDWQIVVASSGIAAEKTGAARDAYNRLSEGAALLLRLWNEEHSPADSLGAAIASCESAADRLVDTIRRHRVRDWPAASLERRLAHFRREDDRIPAAIRAFRSRDRAALRELSQASQSDARELLGNQIPQTVELVECARTRGAFAACSFGAGFGGGAWALVERDRAEAFPKEWMEEYARKNQRAGSHAFTATPGPAVTDLSSGGA